MSSATNSTSETLAATPKSRQGCIRPCSRQGTRQPHSPVESDNGSACCLADGKRHRTTEQCHGQSIRN
ncbi:tail fiber protein [Escherichia coli]|nr:tail fiber protein [Escherichia coli]